MKPIRVRNPDIGVKMKPTGVADLNAEVKMKLTLMKMKPIGVDNLNVEVGMPETVVADVNTFVKMNVTL